MTPGDSAIPPMREVEIASARRALGGQVDLLARHSDSDQGRGDGGGEIQGNLAARVGAEDLGIEFRGDLGADREAAGLKARTDPRDDRGRVDAVLTQESHGVLLDPGPSSTPAAVEERAACAVQRDDRDRRAVGGRNANPGIACLDEESVRMARRGAWLRRLGFRLDDGCAVHLMEKTRLLRTRPDRSAKTCAVFFDRILSVADTASQVEGRVRPFAHAAQTGRHPEPDRLGKRAGFRAPETNSLLMGRGGHRKHIDRAVMAAQALCVSLALVLGCAHTPVTSSGSEARDRFLATYAGEEVGTRGVGTVDYHRGDLGRSGLRARWVSAADSVSAVVYAGPVRTADASILGDSVYLALRPYQVALGGKIPASEGLGASGARFLVRPWSFASVRSSLESAATEPIRDGWRLTGEFRRAEGTHPFVLEIDQHSNPRTLRIQGAHGEPDQIVIRYGPMRTFDHGKAPRWVEWSHEDVRVRLDIEEHAAARRDQFRHVPGPAADWKFLSISEPEGRDLLDRLLGTEGKEHAP